MTLREAVPRDVYQETHNAYLVEIERAAREVSDWELRYNLFSDPRSMQILIGHLRATIAALDDGFLSRYVPEIR